MITVALERIATERGITMAELEQKTGIPLPLIQSYWYNSAKLIKCSDLEKLCVVLHCELTDLVNFGAKPLIPPRSRIR